MSDTKIVYAEIWSQEGECCSCSSEIMHDRRMVLWPKLIALERRLEKQTPEPWKAVQCLSPGQDNFYNFETKHNGRRAPRSVLFIFAVRSQERRPQSQISVLGLSPSESGSCSWETELNRTAQKNNIFVSARRLQELRSQTQKILCVGVSVKMLCLGIVIVIFCSVNWCVSNHQALIIFHAIKVCKREKYVSDFPTVTLWALCWCLDRIKLAKLQWL
jgi:hypothetical protein